MKRNSIYLSEAHWQELKDLAKKTGIRQAELIRRAVEEYLRKSEREPPEARRV